MKNRIPTGLCRILRLAGLGLLTAGGAAQAQVVFNTPLPQYPGGGYVTVTYLGLHGAGDDEYLFLDTPGDSPFSLTGSPGDTSLYAQNSYGGNGGNVQQLIDNQQTPAGYTVDLGAFAAGTEVEFGIFNWDGDNGGSTWLDGPGSRNANGNNAGGDSSVHAYLINNFSYSIDNVDGSGTCVGFEDLDNFPGGNGGFQADDNYADLQFIFNGVQGSGQQLTVPDGRALPLPSPRRSDARPRHARP